MDTINPVLLISLARCYLDLACADLLGAFELALVDFVIAERPISWGSVRGDVDPVAVPEIPARYLRVRDPE